MKLFVDAAGGDLRGVAGLEVAHGAITGASPDRIREVRGLLAGPLCAAVAPGGAADMLRQARALAAVARDVVVMLPATSDGLAVVEGCAAERIAAGVTDCASPVEVLRAARAGARAVIVATGGGGATAGEAMDAVRRIVASLRSYGYATEVLVTGVTSPGELVDAAIAGAHVAIVPPTVLAELARGTPDDAGRAAGVAAGPRAGR